MNELHNPYVGLRPFFLRDSLHFFGRDTQTAELLAVLRQHRFLAVVGSSGSGKSSLVRAGLLPALLGGFLVGDRDRWRIVQVKPGDTPMRNLAAGLLAATSETPPTDAEIAALEADIRDEQADAVAAFVSARVSSRQSLFVLVDQFEEVFAFRRGGDDQRAEASDFVALLMALAEEHTDVPVFVALTMRTDFLGDCDLFYGLPEIMNRGQYLVPRLTRPQLRLAIEGPAMLTGAHVAPQLMDLLLNQLGDREDRLPVIQHALLRTWDAWHAAGATGPIDVRHFQEAGGLENALNLDAEAALAEVKAALPALDDRVVARVFKALTDTDVSHRAVRRPARINDLVAAAGTDRATVDTIIRCFSHRNRNFLYADGWPEAADPRVDISHESLIRQWTRLRDWVAEEREMRDQFTALVSRARSWQKHGVVLRGNELKSAEAWWSSAQPTAGWARRYAVIDDDFDVAQRFLTSSAKARLRSKVTWAASAAVLVTAVGGFLMSNERDRARTAFETELLRDMESHATLLLERDPESAIVAGLFAVESHQILYPGSDLPVALEAILLRAWQESALTGTRQLPFDADADYAVMSADGAAVLLWGATAIAGQSGVKAYNLDTGAALNSTESPELTEGCTAFSPDGQHVHFSTNGISVRWSAITGEPEEVKEALRGDNRRWVACAYAPDASQLALVTNSSDGLEWVLTLAAVTPEGITRIRDVRLLPKADELTALRFSQTGSHVAVALATAGTGTRLIVAGTRSSEPTRTFTTPNLVSDLALSRNGALVTVEEAFSYGLFVRDIEGDGIAVLLPDSGSDDDYGGLAFSADGEHLAAVNGNIAKVWELWTGLAIGSFSGHPRAILAVGFNAQGHLVTVGQDADVRYWRAGNRETHAFQHDQNLLSAVMSSSGTTLFTTTNDGVVRSWDVSPTAGPASAEFDSTPVLQLALSPDGATLAELAVPAGRPAGSDMLSLRIVDARSGRLLAEWEGGSPRSRLAFSPDSRRLALSGGGRTRVWTLPAVDAKPYRPSDEMELSDERVWNVVFEGVTFSLDPGSRQVATINGRDVFLWNAATGGCEGRIEAQSPVFAVSYVPGGDLIATGDELGRVRFWPLELVQLAGCGEAAQAPGQPKRVAPESTVQAHRAPVRTISFAEDGSRFATASDDRTAKVWDTATGRDLLTIRHARAVTHASLSSNGGRLMTAVDDQGAKVWEIPLRSQLVAAARSRLTRNCLSKEERALFYPGAPVDDPPCVVVGR